MPPFQKKNDYNTCVINLESPKNFWPKKKKLFQKTWLLAYPLKKFQLFFII